MTITIFGYKEALQNMGCIGGHGGWKGVNAILNRPNAVILAAGVAVCALAAVFAPYLLIPAIAIAAIALIASSLYIGLNPTYDALQEHNRQANQRSDTEQYITKEELDAEGRVPDTWANRLLLSVYGLIRRDDGFRDQANPANTENQANAAAAR